MTIKTISVVRKGSGWTVTALIETEQIYSISPIKGGAKFALLNLDGDQYCLNLRTGTLELETHPSQYMRSGT